MGSLCGGKTRCPGLLLSLRSGSSRSFFWAWAAKLFRWSRRASSTDTVPFNNIWTIGGDFRLIRLWLVTSAPAFVLFLTLCLPRKPACRNQHNAKIISKFKILKWGHSWISWMQARAKNRSGKSTEMEAIRAFPKFLENSTIPSLVPALAPRGCKTHPYSESLDQYAHWHFVWRKITGSAREKDTHDISCSA